MRKILALSLALAIPALPAALIDGAGSSSEAAYRLKHTKRTCTKVHMTGQTHCTTVVWYTDVK